MANNYLGTGNVKMFPSTYRRVDSGGKFTSERNFVNIINALTDNKSYVLSFSGDSLSSTVGELEVVIAGYYFRVSNYNISGDTWLSIKVETDTNCLVSFESASSADTELDKDNMFYGLRFSSSAPSEINDANYTITHLQVSSDGEIVNKYRLSTDSIFGKNYNDVTKNLTELLADKQKNIVTEGTLNIKDGEEGKAVLSIDDSDYIKYNEQKKVKSDGKTIIMVNDSGHLQHSSDNVGCSKKETNYFKFQNAYLNSGKLTGGQTIYISNGDPSSTEGVEGDFWFKYQD